MPDKVNIGQVDDKIILQSITNLAANGVLVGEVVPVTGYTHITGFAFSDTGSTLNGLIVEQAMQASDFPAGTPATSLVTSSQFTLAANDIITNNFSAQIIGSFIRVVFTNGPVAQTSFRIYFEARVLRGL